MLGIFGREGVFAASLWELDGGTSYINAAFNMYRNYDGAGGTFGDTSIDADTSNIAQSSVYASVDSSDPNRMIVVAINRTANPLTTGIAVTHDRVFDHAEVYRLTSSSTTITQQADIQLDLLERLPIHDAGLQRDDDGAHLRRPARRLQSRRPGRRRRFHRLARPFGQTGNLAADANEDNLVDAEDYALWKSNFGRSETRRRRRTRFSPRAHSPACSPSSPLAV